MTEDEMVGWHHRLDGHEFEQTVGDSEGQGNLACCNPWRRRVGHDLATCDKEDLQMKVLHNPWLNKGCNYPLFFIVFFN